MSGSDSGDSGDGERVAIETAAVWPADTDTAEGVVANWFAREGRQVDVGETVCEIQVDKVSVDVPAPVAGTLDETVLHEGDEFGRGATLGWIRVS